MKKNTAITIIVIVIVLIVGLLLSLKEEKSETKFEERALGTFLYQSINPQEDSFKIPETNPFKFETNPINKVKINPFE